MTTPRILRQVSSSSNRQPLHHDQDYHENRNPGLRDVLRLSASSVLQTEVPSALRPRRLLLSNSAETVPQCSKPDASTFAKNSSYAGYMDKLGKNIVEYKRRFFVLSPATHLYYFVSTSDTAPRGCLDLEGAKIVVQGERDIQVTTKTKEVINLRARNAEMAQKWANSMQQERLSHTKDQMQKYEYKIEQLEGTIKNLENHLDSYKLVENDRDGAIQDAKEWKNKYEKLENGLHILTRKLSKPPGDELDETSDSNSLDLTGDEETLRNTSSSNLHSLTNACQKLYSVVRLASEEAASAVEDLSTANKAKIQSETRLEQVERNICQLWEENGKLRTEMKQKKIEKKVLVTEVKSLMQQLKQSKEEAESLRNENVQLKSWGFGGGLRPPPKPKKRQLESPDKKLLFELEEQVASSLRLHEKFLVDSCGPKALKEWKNRKPYKGGSPLRPRSLLDTVSAMDEGVCPSPSPLSFQTANSGGITTSSQYSKSSNDKNSLTAYGTNPPSLCTTSSTQSDFTPVRPVVTRNGTATTRLACPLVEVTANDNHGDGKVYHLTFHKKKIGLQFQKAPASGPKSTGILNEAMADDLISDEFETNKIGNSVSEIKRNSALLETLQNDTELTCPTIFPEDVVLVCGLRGFDNSANNPLPQIGARLIAFDEISIEVGPWSFESVHKAIRARGRPLTLSFRNDFLNSKQRKILTKAVVEVENCFQIPRPTLQHKSDDSVNSFRSKGQPFSRNNQRLLTDEISVDTNNSRAVSMLSPARSSETSVGYTTLHSPLKANGTPSTISDFQLRNIRQRQYNSDDSDFDSISSISQKRSTIGFRSFSEAGTSSIVSTTFAPLVAGLMSGLSKNDKEDFTPSYLHRESNSLNSSAFHQDFEAGLL